MLRAWVASTCLLLPLLSFACEHERYTCEKQFRELVVYRSAALADAFGDSLGILPQEIQLKFVDNRDPLYSGAHGGIAYDQAQRTMLVPRRLANSNTPNPLRWARSYWPFYQDEAYIAAFPVIAAIDSTLWAAYLQEAAHRRGLSWPHKECSSVDVSERLPCEMLVDGVSKHVQTLRQPLFNSNRLDRIWPEDFARFTKRLWRTDPEYADVQRYGGILLVQPLINEFGMFRALAYIATTPFHVEDNNLRTSALRYQQQARLALKPAVSKPDNAGAAAGDTLASSTSWLR